MPRPVLSTTRLLALAALALAGGPATGVASAAPHVRISPTTITAGSALTVKITNTRAKSCTVSLRARTKGALISTKVKVKKGTSTISIPAATATGGWNLGVRCGSQKAVQHFTVASAPPADLTTKTAAPAPSPDDQGFVAGLTGVQDLDPASGGQLGGGAYANSRIADIGLSLVGRNLYTPGPLDHGQCKQAVNDWVAQASGHTQVMGVDYYANYAKNGGTQVSRDDAIKGDIIQLDNPADISNYYRGMHTAVVVSHTPGSETFDVVDSNFALNDVVQHHTWNPYSAGRTYGLRVTIWRMGTADTPAPAPAPAPVSTPAPAPAAAAAPTVSETTGGVVNKTFTNYSNAGGTIGPGIPSNATIQITCKVTGFTVADGNTWWYRIASNPWNNTYYASADAFYNNGATSGSLHGTPFVDPGVPNC